MNSAKIRPTSFKKTAFRRRQSLSQFNRLSASDEQLHDMIVDIQPTLSELEELIESEKNDPEDDILQSILEDLGLWDIYSFKLQQKDDITSNNGVNFGWKEATPDEQTPIWSHNSRDGSGYGFGLQKNRRSLGMERKKTPVEHITSNNQQKTSIGECVYDRKNERATLRRSLTIRGIVKNKTAGTPEASTNPSQNKPIVTNKKRESIKPGATPINMSTLMTPKSEGPECGRISQVSHVSRISQISRMSQVSRPSRTRRPSGTSSKRLSVCCSVTSQTDSDPEPAYYAKCGKTSKFLLAKMVSFQIFSENLNKEVTAFFYLNSRFRTVSR